MANFQNNSITEYGRLLLAEVQAGAVFIPTRIVLGSGNLPAGKEPTTMTDVVSPVKDLNINKKEKTPDGKVVFGGAYDNQGVTKPFYLRELALYARAEYRNEDGSVKKAVDEVLYSYGNAGATADYMPAYSTETVVEKQLDIVVYVGNSAKVELTIASGTAMTVEMGEQMVDGLRQEVGQALEGKAEKTHTHTSKDITGLDEAMSGALEGKADKEHTHTKKDITDFPTSLPASDVYEWAKQPGKPAYTAGEVGALQLNGWQAATDYNVLTESGIYQCQGVNLNTPYGSNTDTHFYVMVFKNSDQWIRQVAYDVRGQNCYTRVKTNNVWSSWQQIMLGSDVTSLLAGKQDASTAINTGNIGSQNVSYSSYSSYAGHGSRGTPGTSCLRDISAGTADLTAGSSALTSGNIYLVYE